jgi:hypothetical protein
MLSCRRSCDSAVLVQATMSPCLHMPNPSLREPSNALAFTLCASAFDRQDCRIRNADRKLQSMPWSAIMIACGAGQRQGFDP